MIGPVAKGRALMVDYSRRDHMLRPRLGHEAEVNTMPTATGGPPRTASTETTMPRSGNVEGVPEGEIMKEGTPGILDRWLHIPYTLGDH